MPDQRNNSYSYDVIVLGAGIVGVGTALQLQARGLSVAIVDRKSPGEEASYGNAGVIERDGHVPISFPSRFRDILRYARNREIGMRYDPLFLPQVSGWLLKLWRNSNPEFLRSYGHLIEPVRREAINEHLPIAEAAGALPLFRDNGWFHVFRSASGFEAAQLGLDFADEYGVAYELVNEERFAELEPDMSLPTLAGAIYWKDTWSVASPGHVTKLYAQLFEARGGVVLKGDAQSLMRVGEDWSVVSNLGQIKAPKVVVALGAWSKELVAKFGFRFPLAVKRGYHQHFKPLGDAVLNRPFVDEELGFLITPMEDGIRLTSGIEFADRDAPKRDGQFQAAFAEAQKIFPLGEAVEDEPWMGSRPCLPDSLPIVDASGRGDGMYFNFGHGHIGFSSGPLTGRVLAEMITGEEPFIDASMFSAKRFG